MNLTEELKQILYSAGADLVGIGDLSGVEQCEYPMGVSVAVKVPRHIVLDLKNAPTKEYNRYHSLKQKLNELVLAGEKFLKEKGFEAYAQTTDRVNVGKDRISKIPHKTVATRAGLGWIGRNCLLVTREHGSAVRISSLLTNAPLTCDKEEKESHCGGCNLCVQQCPAQALYGTLWKAGMPRKDIMDVESCYQKQVEIMFENTGIKTDLCGKCFAVCVYTKKYLER